MVRKSLAVSLCLMLLHSPALAQPLAPGKPAGVHRAQSSRYYGVIAVGALAAIAIIGYAISAKPYRIPSSSSAATPSTSP